MEQINKQQLWYITGCTSGVGLSLTTLLLNLGHKVSGTSRDIKKLESLSIFKHESFLGLQVDIADSISVNESIEKTIKHFGSNITHVINNAGFGLLGSVEETSDAESRKLMDALYFGPLNVIRSILPYFRENKDGYIFNIGSIGGFKGVSNRGNYGAAKSALAIMSESLALDVKSFNIKVTCIILGYIVTGFQQQDEFANNLIADYQTVQKYQERLKLYENVLIRGDPNKVAQIIYENSTKPQLPYYLFIGGTDIFTMAQNKLIELNGFIDTQKERNSNIVIDQQ